MTWSVQWQLMTNAITRSAPLFQMRWVRFFFCPYRHWRETVKCSACSGSTNFPQKTLTHLHFSKQWEVFFSFWRHPTLISAQLPPKHNRCLPTRLPSISCLVTNPLLSTTECLTNSLSELNLEMPLIYPPSLELTEVGCTQGVTSEKEPCLILTHNAESAHILQGISLYHFPQFRRVYRQSTFIDSQ